MIGRVYSEIKGGPNKTEKNREVPTFLSLNIFIIRRLRPLAGRRHGVDEPRALLHAARGDSVRRHGYGGEWRG